MLYKVNKRNNNRGQALTPMDIRSMNVVTRLIGLTFCTTLLLYVVYVCPSMLSKFDTKVSTTDSNISIKSIHNVLNTILHFRLPLEKLDTKLKLDAIVLWMVLLNVIDKLHGAEWYNTLWETHEFGGCKEIDYMLSLKPCKDHKDVFIQIAAHLGIQGVTKL